MPDQADPAQVIARAHGAHVVAGREYRTELPPQLAPWHCYIVGGGHSIVVLLAATTAEHDQPAADPAQYTVPAPVKAVLRAGWTVRDDGFIVTDLPYDRVLGLITDPEDDELDADTPPDTEVHRYAVGELYHPHKTRWPDGASAWRLTDTGVDLALFFGSPTKTEIDAVRTGQAGFALLTGQHALVLAHRFTPGMPWSDTPWQACRQPEPTGLPLVGAQGHLLISVILIDSTTGLICALRQTSWTKNFADAVRKAIRTQALNKSTDNQGATEIDAWYRRYSTTADLVRHADATTKG